ncbi:hypothetical protein [Streptomyces scopuliridis]|uniref:hypothetical protein n=1 Tax=Streptomyces scopuliridis TaxID=452529 RepID=UPI00068BED43
MTTPGARPLPARRTLFGAGIAVAYMNAAVEGIDAPYGALVDLARDIDTVHADAFDAADRIRSCRI